jgi:hypothetical protein
MGCYWMRWNPRWVWVSALLFITDRIRSKPIKIHIESGVTLQVMLHRARRRRGGGVGLAAAGPFLGGMEPSFSINFRAMQPGKRMMLNGGQSFTKLPSFEKDRHTFPDKESERPGIGIGH